MKPAPYSRFLFVALALAPLAGLLAQSPTTRPATSTPPPPANLSRLQQLENTYQFNLKLIDAPVLRDYLRDLDKLKLSMTAQGRTLDAAQVDAEISRIKQISGTTGILVLEPPGPPPPPPKDGRPPPPDRPIPRRMEDRVGADAVVLAAADALPDPNAPPSAKTGANTTALALGHASWKIPHVAPGTYDLLAFYACPVIDAGRTVTAVFGGNTLSHPLVPGDATKNDQNFRLLRLGQITVEKDVTDAVLSLQVATASPSDNVLRIRSVILARPRPRPKADK